MTAGVYRAGAGIIVPVVDPAAFDRSRVGDFCHLRSAERHHTFGGTIASSRLRRMTYELLAIAIPVCAVVLMVVFGLAVQRFLINVPAVERGSPKSATTRRSD